MRLRKGDIVELWIDRMAYGGHGVARFDGFVIFVRGAIPGDRIMARVVKKKKDYANGNLLELIESSPDRVEAPCPYSGHCGGCQWQHLRYERQLEYKKEQIKDSMARIGSIPEALVHEVIPSSKIYGYRNKMEFSFSDHRWLLPKEYEKGEKGDDFGLGLHVPGTFYKVIDMEACLLQHDTGNRILQEVKRYVRESGVPVYGLKSHEGFWRFLSLRYSVASDEWMVNLVTSEDKGNVIMPLAEALCMRINNIRTVVNNISRRKAAVALGESEVILTGKGHINDRIGPFNFQVSANSFFQTNSAGAEKLYKTVLEYSGLNGSEVVLDLYCGTGTIPIFLSGRAKEVIGMEIAESAVLDAIKNCKKNNVSNCRFILGDIREKLRDLKLRPDILIIDPPRAGIHKDILEGIMRMATKRVIYVSCNPVTMARDIGRMLEKYELVEIQPVDMFPHTYHIEAVAKLVLRTDL
ncbi:23S rRNA (uracil(1939)-C(5))-methyltransferase RlmD [Thermodesulfobacteriota bacterium]